ncbi:MAG: branched-chain amino acid ABC transporter permease [Alphaproteobacteria bacterium]|nr:branched-chain amino acid ABC transporter permease [Alphaproteobacteria bacterium]
MSSQFVQFLIAGINAGAIYALIALGFAIIYNASHVINFAQGEFVMLGGMMTVFLLALGMPLPIAVLLAIAATAVAGMVLEKLAIEPARGASVVTLIIITIGASILLRGLVQVAMGRNFHRVPPFTGDDPIPVLGAALLPQNLWVCGVTVLAVLALRWFFTRTMWGKAILATSHNRLAAELVGINVRLVMLVSFGLSGALGALAGVLIAPITLTHANVGIMLGLKGFCAAILGGLGNFPGAVAGGLVLGLAEAMAAGYLSSQYKDAVAFVLILAVLFFLPGGLMGRGSTERV